jgi:hypothetical protein
MDGKKIYNRVPPSKISMKEVDRVVMHRLSGLTFGGATKHAYTIDIYAKYGKFSTSHYSQRMFIGNEYGGLYFTTVGNVKYNTLSSIVIGYYEKRTFYAPKFNSTVEKQNYFGTLR